jgi:hypothetical protein
MKHPAMMLDMPRTGFNPIHSVERIRDDASPGIGPAPVTGGESAVQYVYLNAVCN